MRVDLLPCTEAADFDAMSVEKLDEVLRACRTQIFACVLIYAKAWMARVKKTGTAAEVEALIPPSTLARIAEGVMMPETYVRLGGRCGRIMGLVAALPPSEQRRLCDRDNPEPIAVAERDPEGKVTHRMYLVHNLPDALVRQVFAECRIRTLAEQVALPAEPITRPVVKSIDLEEMLDQMKRLANECKACDKRGKKRAANEMRTLAEKIALLVS